MLENRSIIYPSIEVVINHATEENMCYLFITILYYNVLTYFTNICTYRFYEKNLDQMRRWTNCEISSQMTYTKMDDSVYRWSRIKTGYLQI